MMSDIDVLFVDFLLLKIYQAQPHTFSDCEDCDFIFEDPNDELICLVLKRIQVLYKHLIAKICTAF